MKRFLPILILLSVAGCARHGEPQNQQTPCTADDTAGGATIACENTQGKAAPKGKGKILYYRNPMGLPDTSLSPKKDPMGMDYIPVYENDVDLQNGAGIVIAPNIIQTIGVRTTPVQSHEFGRKVRAFGAVEESTRLQSVVSARVEGWVDQLVITAVGDEVKKGDLLFRLYSPDLIAAQQDFLVAVRSGSEGRAKAAARRLKSLGLQQETIEALRKSRHVEERAPIFAERDGLISALDVREGAFVRPGERIAMIQNYKIVWVIASIAEQDLSGIEQDMRVRLDFPNVPNAARNGVIDYVYPTVDTKTRTGRIRIVLDNEDGFLRPGAYADVTFAVDSRVRLAVPSEAVLHDSRGAYVVLALGEGRFAPAPVETGLVATGYTEILNGVTAGDKVVVSAQFLIDSESNLRESLHKMMEMESGKTPAGIGRPHADEGSGL